MVFLNHRIRKLLEQISKAIYSDREPITEYRMKHVKERLADESKADPSDWEVMTSKEVWGGHMEVFYFHTTVTIPERFAGKKVVYELRTGKEGEWDAINPQFMAYVNGQMTHGLDVNHRQVLLSECAEAGAAYEILLSAYTGDNNFSLLLDSEIKVVETEVMDYYYDAFVPWEVTELLDHEDQDYIRTIRALNESLNLVDLRKVWSKEFFASIHAASEYLKKEYYDKLCGHTAQIVRAVGHTHIDCAWLWTLRTTEDKAVRSFSTVIDLMDRYPEYKFMSSQPLLYTMVKKNAPELYEKIRARIAEGRWETEGGMYVEADCNITSGESLVRQFLYGKKFFREEFGKDNEILWLPDVFGYSAALPQIMKKSGINYFMTTKISWSEFNQMPYDTFRWEGIDGTEVLTHFSPSRGYDEPATKDGKRSGYYTTYNAMMEPHEVKGAWQRYQQKYLNDEVLMSYGFGDGGGGPTEDMLEQGRRLAKGLPGCPRVEQTHALEFFRKLEQDVAGDKYLPKWVGELYLEYHRGTYTSMARNKKYNRRSEFAYENLEFFRSLAEKLTGLPYPRKEIDAGWEIILKNQFHDIIPGSSIFEVYEDSKKEYEEILATAAKLTAEARDAIAAAAAGDQGDVVIFNPNSASDAALVRFKMEGLDPEKVYALTGDNQLFPMQYLDGEWIAVARNIPAKGYRVLKVKEFGILPMCMSYEDGCVDSPALSARINEKGQFTSIYDKWNQRELILPGEVANRIVSYEDKPHNYDNWDINNYYPEKSWEVDDVQQIRVIAEGPVCLILRIDRAYLDSTVSQELYFYADLTRIDIRNLIDWKEEQVLLRDYFPLDVHTNEATYEIQYGHVKRPTHANTSWDFAKFEVCAHKWIDVSEDDYGVSVLNDCKYGYSVKGSTVGLTMLKSGLYPNPKADKEKHEFWYSVVPHTGDFRQAGTVKAAYFFNNPYTAVVKENRGGELPAKFSLVDVPAENVVIEVVKQSEDGAATTVRVFESWNRRTRTELRFPFPVKAVYETGMLEEKEKELAADGFSVPISLKPFEIATYRIEF